MAALLLCGVCVLLALATPSLAAAYLYNMPTPSSSDVVAPPASQSKLIVQSLPLESVYGNYVVTSKPLNLRKYNKNGSKTKKPKKDSKIYYIPIPPLPYRFIPGIGYDYQPMKINPIMQEVAPSTGSTTPAQTRPLAANGGYHMNGIDASSASKLLRVQHHNDYYFNGRPFRLQVAHAGRKHALTPLNLKSKFYYNKNIIY